MAPYVEYPLEDGSTVLIEIDGATDGKMIKASNKDKERVKSKLSFKQAFDSVKSSITEVLDQLDSLKVEEAEIKFGLKTTGEVGVFAVGKVGSEVNYEVTLKWKKPETKK